MQYVKFNYSIHIFMLECCLYAGIVLICNNYFFMCLLMKNLMHREFKQVALKGTDYNWQSSDYDQTTSSQSPWPVP